jgi:hypothetical protein
VKPETVGLIVAAFRADGVPCEIDWLYLELDDFKTRLAAPPASKTDPASPDWELRETTVLPDLVELRLHPPQPGNEFKDSYYVDATLLFGSAICDYDPEDGQATRAISIALRDARLAIGSESYRPLRGSMIGERVKSENFRRVAGGIEITGPAPAGTLDGNAIGDQHLCVIGATNAPGGSDNALFVVTVAAGRRSFVVAEVDASPDRDTGNDLTGNKDAILNVFIYRRCGKDESGRAVLAEATIKRRIDEDETL